MISDDHKVILEWFEKNEGRILKSWPTPIGRNQKLFLVNRAKGIHKPAGIEYSSSLRVSHGEAYGDGPDVFPDGSWRLFYHMELRKNDPNPLNFATNVGALKCMDDAVPIGVIHQVSKNPNRYRVFGLGIITGFENKHFIVEGPTSSDRSDPVSNGQPSIDTSKILEDLRNKTLAQVYRRQGQGKFRSNLLEAYSGKCAISGCSIKGLLDAAHILPHRGQSSDVIQNGILLRTDLHTLFDLGLISIDHASFRCSVHQDLREDPDYKEFCGRKISLPQREEHWPNKDCLRISQDLKSKN